MNYPKRICMVKLKRMMQERLEQEMEEGHPAYHEHRTACVGIAIGMFGAIIIGSLIGIILTVIGLDMVIKVSRL